MTVTRDEVLETLRRVPLPEGGNLLDADMVRALTLEGDAVRFVIEVAPDKGRSYEPVRAAAQRAVEALPGVRAASVLLTARTTPAQWGVTLPDLLSRLRAAQPAFLGPPDDQHLREVMVKLLADRQLEVDVGVLDYLLLRMERSFAAASSVVDALDRESLARGRRITRAIAADVLDPPDSD